MSTVFCTTTSSFRAIVCGLVTAGLLCAAGAAQKQDLSQRLADMSSTNSLADVTKPWHLRLAFTIMEANGAPSREGEVEMWHAGQESRTVTTLGQNTFTEYVHAGKHYRSAPNAGAPNVVSDLLDSLLHAGPGSSELEDAKPELRTQKSGDTPLECIMLSRAMVARPGQLPDTVPLGLFPTYCMVSGTNRLAVSYSFGEPATLRTNVGRFVDHDVAVAVTLRDGKTVIAEATVKSLSTFQPEDEFTPPADSKEVDAGIPVLTSPENKDRKIGGEPVQYPASARQNHVSGTVILHARIGTDGRIRRLTLVSAPSPDLAIAALSAVRTYRYKPYLVSGEPVDVETTITVNFNLTG